MINNNEQSITSGNSSNIFINLNSLLPDSSHTLDAAFLDTQDLLRTFAIDRNAQAQIVATAFGSDVDEKVLAQWVQPWGQGDFSGLPAIEIRSDSELNGALGVYAAATDMIYLNQEFIASAPQAQIVAVLLEEIGHGLDARINAVDAPGDEGAIFAALVLGETLSAPQLQKLKQEDDSATIVIDGRVLSVEQATVPVNSLSLIQQIGSDIDGELAFEQLGTSVALSSNGSVVAIGARDKDGNGSNSGHVRLYENISGTWQQIGSDIDGEAEGNLSGESVSLSADGSVVAIGAHRNDDNGSNSGHVRLYENNGGTWQQIGRDIDGETAGDLSGFSVSLSADGSVIAIGAIFNDGNGDSSGHVRLYQVGQRGVEDTPIATDDTGFTANNKFPTTIMAADLLANDTGVDNVLALTTVGNAVGGTVSLDAAGNVVFQANADFSNDTATFEYTVSDGNLTDIGIVSVLVGGIIYAGNGNDPIVGGDGGDVIKGGDANNDIDGGGGNDVLYGRKGNDVLVGGLGDDQLHGGSGSDVLIGGLGNDQLTSRSGKDVFAFSPGDGGDIITDYTVGKDTIGLMGGLAFGDLTLNGNTISITASNEVLATLTGIDTTTLTAADFVIG